MGHLYHGCVKQPEGIFGKSFDPNTPSSRFESRPAIGQGKRPANHSSGALPGAMEV